MSKRDLPDNVRRLIQASVPTIDALEILLYLVRRPGSLSPSDIMNALLPTVVSEPILSDYLALLTSQGIIKEVQRGFFAYAPVSQETADDVALLVQAYNERPVTLIRTVYSIADSSSIRHFADAFRLRKNP